MIVCVFVLVVYLAWSTYKPNRFKTVYTDFERKGLEISIIFASLLSISCEIITCELNLCRRPHPPETRGRLKKGAESHVKFGHLERLQRAIDAEENDKLLELNERYKSNANKSDKSDISSTTESLTSSESSYSKRVLDSDTD